MVIAVLAIIWVVCLTPMMLRKLSERRFLTSVDSFHRQLRGLRRGYPRLAASAADHEAMLYTSVPLDNGTAASARPRSFVSERPLRRAQMQATRRRRVLLSLGGTIIGCLVLGMIPALRILWGLSLLAFAAAAAYIALLIYIHRRAVERRVKVVDIRDLRRDASPETSEAWSRAAAHRRSSEDIEWGDDDMLDAAVDYDYDEIMAGGR